jgi:predicted O-methyltransferase YrrM
MAGSAAAVDAWLAALLIPEAERLDAVLAANAAAGLPGIDVSALQGRMLGLLVRISGARRVLEVGTLGGFSTICMARALPEGGRLVTVEVDPHHASVARANIAAAGVAERVEVLVGAGLEVLPGLEGVFDLVFIDADKTNNAAYLAQALRLSRPGTVILGDNVVRGGGVVEGADGGSAGARRLLEAMAAEPRLEATVIQTVGAKGWDGFALAVVR